MKIIVDYKDSESGFNQLKIDSAKYLSDYAIRIKFSDGNERLVDFKPFLSKSLHPSIKKYLDENKFSNFSLTDGNLNWNDYDPIFPLSDLYRADRCINHETTTRGVNKVFSGFPGVVIR